MNKVFFFSTCIVTIAVLFSTDTFKQQLSATLTEVVSRFNLAIPQLKTQNSATNAELNMSLPRAIRQAFMAIEQSEGAGARVRRSIGTPKLRNFSPFLMLDHFTIGKGAGTSYCLAKYLQ